MKKHFPPGWNEKRVRLLLRHYEEQTEDEAVVEDEASFRKRNQTVMVVPRELVPAITRLIKRKEGLADKTRSDRGSTVTGKRTRRG